MEPETVVEDAPEAKADEPEVVDVEETDEEAEERARVEAAIRAGEEAAERELAADASKIREERDELQKKLADVEDQIEAAKKEAADATERMLRLQADWENFRRRTAAERLAEKERAAEKLVTNLLPVIDDIERAIEHAGATDGDTQFQQFVDGVSAVHAKMLGVLEKEGVEPIDPAGEPFEPLAHQAVGRVEDKDAYDETVAQVYQKGYRMGDKVIRTAMVTVTYGGPKRPTDE
ncbi:MAG TPA: nucleotide exchange factor GrpE [Candidatus Olsenella avicola]|nr:nucleotide exchange factor GrpE [Candidatus Olsenella avicola]